MSPYCTEAIPLMTSTDSTLSVDMLRTSTPVAGEAPPPVMLLEVDRLPAFIAGDSACRLALLDRGAPSTIIAVPRLFMSKASPLSPEPLNVRFCTPLMLEFDIDTPGRSDITSPSEDAWRWSMA